MLDEWKDTFVCDKSLSPFLATSYSSHAHNQGYSRKHLIYHNAPKSLKLHHRGLLDVFYFRCENSPPPNSHICIYHMHYYNQIRHLDTKI